MSKPSLKEKFSQFFQPQRQDFLTYLLDEAVEEFTLEEIEKLFLPLREKKNSLSPDQRFLLNEITAAIDEYTLTAIVMGVSERLEHAMVNLKVFFLIATGYALITTFHEIHNYSSPMEVLGDDRIRFSGGLLLSSVFIGIVASAFAQISAIYMGKLEKNIEEQLSQITGPDHFHSIPGYSPQLLASTIQSVLEELAEKQHKATHL